ncbi:TMV resistance protein N-like [Argentina anserina]|uniref:TMV resistance protein N-like n=1 Tax=Argentina anserina TaxID=57926 RepID=UPI0021768DD4|nr:TMV resistance protein N-like [Potentilla anserina]
MALFRRHKGLRSKCTSAPSGSSTDDVFLSFRGEDTRKTFTDHLYTALINAGFHTFRDDHELERGENINAELAKAIQKSRGYVIVFSRDYISSRWCLDELIMILELKRTSNHVVLPVFYHISPSQLRDQAKTLAEHPKYKGKQSLEKLNSWHAAIGEVADLAGFVLETEADRHEAKFIERIVGVVQKKLPLVSHVPLSQLQKKLGDKLIFVAPFINEAEGKQLEFQECVKPWLHDLKEAIYDADDLVLEIKSEILR